ncbi:MAG: primosomal protein N' [Clostridiales bacterium]|nr:primosomal protein N' [Clostridiales bacterium]
MYCEVIVDVAHSDVDKIFDYACDERIVAGMRVAVPFGNRVTTGFVMRVKSSTDCPPEKLKRVLRAEDDFPAINEECLALTEKIAMRYRCPKALVLRLFLPSEMRTGKVGAAYRTFAKITGDISLISPRAKQQLALAEFLKDNGEADTAFLNERFGSALKPLVEKGIVSLEKRRVFRDPYRGMAGENAEHLLTEEQQRAVRSIEETEKTVTLIHGVTGSGKTEIYLTLIARQLALGKTAIFLVPEISLTPQMLSQLRARFGSSAAILHSGLSAGERFDEWRRLREGAARIAIGARSAIFAPVENIGVIVIDEEHDGSYSSETSPRYNTFDIALLRAKYNGCKLVLGSATPAVETYRRAQQGEFSLVTLKNRINRRPMPQVEIVDLRREVRRGNPSPFSLALRDKLSACLESGNQAILFLNRRGYSQTVICRDCGYVAKCEHCDVALTYHSEEDCLKCHYCGTKYHMLSACPSCGGTHLSYVGTGTQKVVGELKKLYPKARILRMDNDTTSGKEGHLKILKQFSDREADILVGTQMVAKGHDFPLVTLVGILDADMSLHFPDYRSRERTFQLITQVAGRSGRSKDRGEVVLQTYDPENFILRFACDYDYEGFYEYEINLRAATAFPPFAKIVRVMVTGSEEREALDALREVYTKLEKVYADNADSFLFFNKMHAPIKRIQNKFRYQVLMRIVDGKPLKEIYAICAETNYKNTLVYVEENPSNLS